MKLSTWAKSQGISYKTAWRWFKEGRLPVVADQMKTGTILIKEEICDLNSVAIYARVSSADQKKDLDRQIARLVVFANANGWVVAQTITEIGSGLNGHRPKLIKLLTNSNIKTQTYRRPASVMTVSKTLARMMPPRTRTNEAG